MSLETHFRYKGDYIGVMNMARMYPPKLTPLESMYLPWQEFRDRLEPDDVVNISPELELALVSKTSLWAHSDVCGFVGGNRDVSTLEDFTVDEGVSFFNLHSQIVDGVQNLGNIHRDQYKKINVAFGFNPEDFQLGAHSIKRLHTHIFAPEHRLLDGSMGMEFFRKEVLWKDLNWFNRLKFVEPFASIYYDFIDEWVSQNPDFRKYLSRSEVEFNNGFISMYVQKNKNWPQIFAPFQKLYIDLHNTYTQIEGIYTNRAIDPATQRFLPRPSPERQKKLNDYIQSTHWLSSGSIKLLQHTNKYLEPALQRESGKITSAGQAWFTKGFAGTIMFSFDRSDEIRLDVFPRVITTSAPEKAIYGLGKPTIISREEKPPTALQEMENNKFLLAVASVVRNIQTDNL